jgi:hypothetical protein
MRVISASRRTDIPAFYSEWFMNRIRAGYCEVVNPFNSGQITSVSLAPADVSAIVFWTRYPVPLLRHAAELRDRGYRFYFHYSINGYGEPLEEANPALDKAVTGFRAASAVARTIWRYDPVVLTEQATPAWHVDNFARIARELAGHTTECYFSFVDVYGKTRRNLAKRGISVIDADPAALARELSRVAAAFGMKLFACCEDALVGEGVEKGRCVFLPDAALRPAPTRAECGCIESIDIGAYDTCRFGCVYCYATNSREAAGRRAARHDPEDAALWRPAVPSPVAAPGPASRLQRIDPPAMLAHEDLKQPVRNQLVQGE